MFPSRGSTGSLREAALDYASRGWPVLPLRARAKEPLTKHGLLDATTNKELIEGWWHAFPDANIGLRTGHAFDVLDVDGLDGVEAIRKIEDFNLGSGPVSITGKGWHYLFLPTGCRNGASILPKVDFRGANGYIVAPPSVHPLGHEYRWAAGRGPALPLPAAPNWLVNLLEPATEPDDRDSPRVFIDIHGNEVPIRPPASFDLDILDVARQRGIEVIKQGPRYKALCPFHTEDTPSFTLYVKAARQSFYCYGCHAWGDAIDLQRGTPAGHR